MPDPNNSAAPRILPTVGRVVLFHLGAGYIPPNWEATPDGSNTYSARIAYVHSPNMLNLAVDDANGVARGFTSVPLVQGDDEAPIGNWCEWMPYQKGQAARAEQLERQIAERSVPPYKLRDPGAEHERLQDHVRMEREAQRGDRIAEEHEKFGTSSDLAELRKNAPTLNTPFTPGDVAAAQNTGSPTPHPAIAATQQLDNEGNAPAPPTIPQD